MEDNYVGGEIFGNFMDIMERYLGITQMEVFGTYDLDRGPRERDIAIARAQSKLVRARY